MSVSAFIALGSNLGDRREHLDSAIRALREYPGIRVLSVSTYHETEPVGGPVGQGAYLNAAAHIGTTLSPDDLLRAMMSIESGAGRERGEANAPRTLDLDLLLYGELVRPGPDPIIPHPRMHERSFVLDPLAELCPNVRHPVLNVTIRRLAELQRPELLPGLPLAGMKTLVTGSSSGIGRAIADAYARAGAWVIVHGRRSEEQVRSVARELQAYDVATATKLADLRESAAIKRLADEAWRQWGRIDVVVCNAGADTLTGEASHWSFERKLEELLAVDVRSTMQLARDLGARMHGTGHGSIITMGWDQAETGMEGESGQLFAAVKSAVMGFTRSLALSLAPTVRVNCIAPGWIKTAWGEGASKVWQERVQRETPLKRWGTPEDIAGAATWIASRQASYITGQIIRVNGGAVR